MPGRRRHKVRRNRSAKRARKLGLPWEKYKWEDILRRDGKVCYLCDSTFDPEIDHGLPWSPCVDHIIPFDKDNCPGDILSNVKIVHERCNKTKGKKLHTQLDLPLEPPMPKPKKWKEPVLPAEQERYDLFAWSED